MNEITAREVAFARFRAPTQVRLDLVIREVLLEIINVKLSALRQEFHRFPELGFQED